MVDLQGGEVTTEFIKLDCRPMLDYVVELVDKDTILADIRMKVPAGSPGDMVRIKLKYPESWAGLIHNQQIEALFPDAFSVQISHDPIRSGRARLDLTQEVAAYSPGELLGMWMDQKGIEDQEALQDLAVGLIGGSDGL